MSMEKIHLLYDSDNVENGFQPPQLSRKPKLVVEGALPKMIYEVVNEKRENTTSEVIRLKRNPTAVNMASGRGADTAVAAEKAAARRMFQEKLRGGGVPGLDGEKRSKAGSLKTNILSTDEGNYPGRQTKDNAFKEEPRRRSKNFNEKVTVLNNVIEGDRKGAVAATRKSQNKTEKMRLKSHPSQNSENLSLTDRKPGKPVNVDILCGISNKSDSCRLDSDVCGSGVDDELNHLLSQLEFDENFQKLSDNEKMSWMESLFYQDTKPRVHSILTRFSGDVETRHPRTRDQLDLLPPAPMEEPGAIGIKGRSRSPVKMKKDAASNRPTSKTVINTAATLDIKPKSASAEVTVNENLISLAQSYFSPVTAVQQSVGMDQPDIKKMSEVERREHQLEHSDACTEEQPIAVFDNSQTLNNSGNSVDITKSSDSTSSSTVAPPIPPRSVQPKTAMLRLMNSATNILKR